MVLADDVTLDPTNGSLCQLRGAMQLLKEVKHMNPVPAERTHRMDYQERLAAVNLLPYITG